MAFGLIRICSLPYSKNIAQIKLRKKYNCKCSSSEQQQSPDTKDKKLSALERGGTLTNERAAGKNPGMAALRKLTNSDKIKVLQIVDGKFTDDRWIDGQWDINQFKNIEGKIDWDSVIDAEIARRKLLEDSPVASVNGAVKFDTSSIPWWAWVKRFHLPEAEKLNGRAAMVGYFMAIIGEQLSGAGLLEQQNSFLGKLLLHIAVFAILLIREVGDVEKYRNLIDEAFFYDKQWKASWEGRTRPSETEDS